MRLGTGIAGALSRPVPILAMHTSSLCELAPGRTVLGLGASTEAIVSGWMGMPFDRPRARTRQAVEQARVLLKGERVLALTASEARMSGGLTFYRKGPANPRPSGEGTGDGSHPG